MPIRKAKRKITLDSACMERPSVTMSVFIPGIRVIVLTTIVHVSNSISSSATTQTPRFILRVPRSLAYAPKLPLAISALVQILYIREREREREHARKQVSQREKERARALARAREREREK